MILSSSGAIEAFLSCLHAACPTDHPMAAAWHYHLFNLFPTPRSPHPTQPIPSFPPPQPVAYLYPALSNEAINAPQSSSVGDNGRHKSDSNDAADPPPHLSLDGYTEGTLRLFLLDTGERTWPHQCQPAGDKLSVAFCCGGLMHKAIPHNLCMV